MKYEKAFSVGLRSKLLSKVITESIHTQQSKGKIIRDTLNRADFSKVEIRKQGEKIHYDWNDKKRSITIRFETSFINQLDFIAEMKNKSRDELINEALENELLK